MGKRSNYKCNYGDTRILYKKSNTICTQSRTCSGASQFFTRSRIFQYKKNFSHNNDYYIESGKIKRDLSIETDVCILRRYYKSKRNKLSTRDGSNKSKFSNVITEIDSEKEFRYGACGDSKTMTKDTQQVDIAAIMVENLKGLLTNWIQKHLLENKDTQDKIETVLHSILHKGKETKVEKVSSRSTYILSREGQKYEVKNKKVATASLICDYCKHKSRPIVEKSSGIIKDLSSRSVPTPMKKLRVLSTLSIPRKIHVPKNQSLYKVKKIKRINKYSVHDPRKLLDLSSFDLLAISTRSFTKRCTNYGMKRLKKRRIAFHSKHLHQNVSNTSETEEKDVRRIYKEVKKAELEDMPSLVKSIYADHPANVSRPDNINRTTTSDTFTLTENNYSKRIPLSANNNNIRRDDKYTCKASFANTLDERDQSEPLITIDFLTHSMEFPTEREVEQNSGKHNCGVNVNRTKNFYVTKKRKSLRLSKPRNIQNKKFILTHKKDTDNQPVNNNDILKHIKSILEYVAKDSSKENFKLDIHVNLLPVKGKSVDASSCISNIAVSNGEVGLKIIACNAQPPVTATSDESQSTKKRDSSKNTPEIIALLDGATSQAKYIFNTENSTNSLPIKSLTKDQATKTSKLEIVQEIHDLKSVVKNLLHTAETLVSEQLKKETDRQKISPTKNNIVDIKTIDTIKPPNKPISQGIQISNDFGNNLLLAGIKLSKEPKKDITEFCHRLMRKSTSYKIIESESVLRVTDMTVGGKTDNSPEINTLPKSKSLIDVTDEKNKVMAYYCDGGCNKDSRQNSSVSFYKVSSDSLKKPKKKNNLSLSSCECSKNHHKVQNDSQELIPECPTSVYIDVEECCDKKSSIPARKGMGFGEGFIYCLLLWIPVTIIAGLFYNYVIKDSIDPTKHKTTQLSNSMLNLELSDLGF